MPYYIYMQGGCYFLCPYKPLSWKIFPSTAILSFYIHAYFLFHVSAILETFNLVIALKYCSLVWYLTVGLYKLFMAIYMHSCLHFVAHVARVDWRPCSSIDWLMMGNKALFCSTIFLCCCWQLLVECSNDGGWHSHRMHKIIKSFPHKKRTYGNESILWAQILWS